MGFFRVRRSIRLAPGLKINLGKKSASLSVGKPGATVNIGPRGTRATVGLPGTGLSYTTGRLGTSRARGAERVGAGPGPVPQSAVRRFFAKVAACISFLLFLMMFSDDPANHHPWGMAAFAMLFGVLDQSSPPLIPDTTGRLARAVTGAIFLLIGGVWQAVISTQMEGEHLFMEFFAALFAWGGVVQLVLTLRRPREVEPLIVAEVYTRSQTDGGSGPSVPLSPPPSIPASRSPDAVLPERDSWESRDGGSLLDDGFPVSVDLIIDYVDGEGQPSHRRITTKRVIGWGYADAMVDAHCHERDAHRSFRVSRMQQVVDAETGEIIADPAAYLRQRYESSPTGIAAAVMERENVALMVLMYVARCATNLTKPRRDPVLAYLAGRIDVPDPTAVLEALDQGIREYRPTRRDFDGALKALKDSPQDVRQAVVAQARAIAASRKKPDPIEQAVVEMVVQALS